MPIDPNFRLVKGDVVSVEGVVKYDQDADDDRVFVVVPGAFNDLHLKPADLTLVRQNIRVGDRVSTSGYEAGEVLSVAGEWAWVDFDGGSPITRHLHSLTRLPPEAPAEPESKPLLDAAE